MIWWRIVRSRPVLTGAEMQIFSWQGAVVLLLLLFGAVGWYKLGSSPSGFHLQGKLIGSDGRPIAGAVVGYNYAWKGNSKGRVFDARRQFPRVFATVLTSVDGTFAIDLDQSSIIYVSILGFWEDEASFTAAISGNRQWASVKGLSDLERIIPWQGGVVSHYEPGWRLIDWMFGWGAKSVEMFVSADMNTKMKSSRFNKPQNKKH